MRYIKQFSRMSEKLPSMTTPLINHLNFGDITKYGNDVLLGRSEEIPDIDPYTRRYLH